ncbi:helix-turn-helix transcriptional regulator [Edaphobacter modestus]|uniref:AlpA family transcriptional regulator n=1 Tax=Edaphobacter modestus TaxID=388466 RepID=A0A4Q7YVN9_9BACT|nr:AlpA family transcriptional regulator [Edaphobacter modestus]RZU41740.1 AlpA family transcriptional regulator [Edaphobacter modestus]
MSNKILRLPAVKTKTGLSRSAIYARVSQGTFPAALSLGPNTVGWLEADVEAWIDKQIASSRRMQEQVA